MKHFTKLMLASLASRKLWMTLFVVWTLSAAYWGEMQLIYTFADPAQLQTFQAISTQFNWALVTVLLSYLGIHGLTSWHHATSSVLSSVVSASTEKKEETVTRLNIEADFRTPELQERYAEK